MLLTRIKRYLSLGLRVASVTLIGLLLLGSSSLPPGDKIERVRAFTRDIEYDYINWTGGAIVVKLKQFALGTAGYLSYDVRRQTVLDYLELVTRIQATEAELSLFYTDPNILDPEMAAAPLRRNLDALYEQRALLQPVAESVLQGQISEVVAGLGLTMAGQPVPPVLYHSTPLPLALIISPRDVIRQETDVSLSPALTVADYAALEDKVDRALNVSSLVESIGGVGLYPTMVYQTNNLDWMSEVVAHEWIHNYLTLRPLGVNYLKNPQLRIMNETAASIAGKEIGREVLERYYPELVPPPPAPPPPPSTDTTPPEEPAPPVFDYYAEMRITRVQVDELLAEGKIEEAEAYMEMRRIFFWENGYRHLRKLNQAYFAFHGAYADHPSGGAAGVDPVGAAVRALRAQSSTLAQFLERISWMWSFEQLQSAVDEKALTNPQTP